MGPGLASSGCTAAGSPGLGGGGRFRSGSPYTSTPVGADAQRLVAPPVRFRYPTTSHSGAVRTPFPESSSAPGALGQSESIWTVPSVVTAVPGAPLILFVPHPCGSRASNEYGNGMSVPLVATPIAPVRWVACPMTPAKNDGRVAP